MEQDYCISKNSVPDSNSPQFGCCRCRRMRKLKQTESYIHCSCCNFWFHSSCLGITLTRILNADLDTPCPVCRHPFGN